MLVSAMVRFSLLVLATSPTLSVSTPMAAVAPGPHSWRNQSSMRSSLADIRGPIEADGGVQMVPVRVKARCRYGYLNAKRNYKLYRIFMKPGELEYPGWCKAIKEGILNHCQREIPPDDVAWRRCDPDGRDLLWAHGYVATFELHVDKETQPLCVQNVLPETVPGSLVDYMGHLGCYEAYGWELEY